MSGKRCTGVSHHSCARRLSNKTPMAMLYLLAEHARDDGYAWPSQERMAELMNMSVKQVRRTINKLEAMGDLIVKRNRGKGNSNEYLVTAGLSDEQICDTLTTYNLFPNPIQVVQQLNAKRNAVSASFFGHEKGTSESQKGTSGNHKRGHLGAKNSQKGTSGHSKPDITVSPNPLDPEPSSSPEPSEEREPSEGAFALSSHTAINQLTEEIKTSDFKAKETTSNGSSRREEKKTPPSSAPPPPTRFQKTVEALYEACSKRASRRNRPKFTGVAKALHADGFSGEQILLTRRWWDQVGMGSRGATAPHPSQIEECICEAIAWNTKPTIVTSSPSEEEYTTEEIAILQAQLKEAGLI